MSQHHEEVSEHLSSLETIRVQLMLETKTLGKLRAQRVLQGAEYAMKLELEEARVTKAL